MTDLGAACGDVLRILPLGGELLRMVESQQQVATLALVDDLAEQAVLEDLSEQSKPPPAPGSEGRTIYRNPPAPVQIIRIPVSRGPQAVQRSRCARPYTDSLFGIRSRAMFAE